MRSAQRRHPGRAAALVAAWLFPLLAAATALAAASPSAAPPRGVDPSLYAAPAGEPVEFLVVLRARADLSAAARLPEKSRRGGEVVRALKGAATAQAALLAELEAAGVEHRSFWIVNAVWVRGPIGLAVRLAARPEVERVSANPRVRLEPLPPSPPDTPQRRAEAAPAEPEVIEWNLSMVRAPMLWAEGFRGQGAVVGGLDTGYDWDHPALIGHYRGWNGAAADHDYSWHDAIHSGGGVCGPDSPVPCDDGYHGTHTMGTMVGDDGGENRIGMAPEARWIGCRNMDQGFGTPATYLECLQWMIAPTDLQGQNPRPDLAPDVINNSWVCPESEGCTDPLVLQAAVEAVRAAGILVVASAGNSGPECGSVQNPIAIYDASLSVGAVNSLDEIAWFSARGPVVADGSGRLKPDVAAPGVTIRSSVTGGDYQNASGTSMAGPHVAGLAALLRSVSGNLRGRPDLLEQAILGGALPRATADTCGDLPPGAIPNHTFGHGRIDAVSSLAIVRQVLTGVEPGEPAGPGRPGVPVPILTSLDVSPNPFNPLTVVRFELTAYAEVDLRILDARGRQVRTLLAGAARGPGRHEVAWDGRDEAGAPVVSGVYLAVADAGRERLLRKLALIR